MASDEQRDRIFWRVVASSATRPLNLAVLVLMVVSAVIWAPWVAVAAVPVYGLLVAATAKSPREAARVAGALERKQLGPVRSRTLQGLTGDLRRRVVEILSLESRIVRELQSLPVQPAGVLEQVRTLCDEVVETGRRASDVDLYLRSVDVDDLRRRAADLAAVRDPSPKARASAEAVREQLEVIETLRERRRALDEEIDHVEAGLGALRAHIIQARSETAMLPALAGDVTDLRDRMRILAASLAEVYGTRSDPTQGA